jgi:hypothetical protein
MPTTQPIVDILSEIYYMLQLNLVVLGLILAILIGSCLPRDKR